MKISNHNFHFAKISALAVAIAAFSISSCKKEDPVPPVEEELITTIRLTVSNAGLTQTYVYKVQNGFNQTTPGTVQADTLRLKADSSYSSSIQVLNESASPVEDVTSEIIAEKDEHLFLYTSNPATGGGSVAFSGGNPDDQSRPFNLTGKLKAGGAGQGTLRIFLKHQPTNKFATTSAEAGPDTDAEAVFPVLIQ